MAYTIVSFCGGGVRGLMPAKLLKMLVDDSPGILTKTDLFAGTSIGSAIVGMLVSPVCEGQKTCTCLSNLIDMFYDQAKNFYPYSNPDPNAPAYPNKNFIETAKDLFHDRPLSSLRQKVLFTAFNVGAKDKPWQPLLFTNVPNAPVPTESATIVDAVISSGAMPGMLASYQGNVDGAFVHHDPTLAAIALAVNSGVDPKEIVAICFGTGFMASWIGSDTAQWGAEQWLNGDGTQNYQLPSLLVNDTGVNPMLNLCLNGTSTNLIPMLSSMLLPDRYVYLNPVLDQYVPENAHSQKQIWYLSSKAEEFPGTHPETWERAKSLLRAYW